jgi:hypothetical protein
MRCSTNEPPLFEPLHLLRNCGARPADWAVPDVMAGRTLCCDLAVTDPLQAEVRF